MQSWFSSQHPAWQSFVEHVPLHPSSAPAHWPAQSGVQALHPLAVHVSPAGQRLPVAAQTHWPD